MLTASGESQPRWREHDKGPEKQLLRSQEAARWAQVGTRNRKGTGLRREVGVK